MNNMNTMNTKYAINVKKQAELDALNAQVSKATYQVEQLQAIVTSLNQKNSDFAAFLADATADRDTALSNLNLLNQVINGIKEMNRAASLTVDQTSNADSKINQTATQMSVLINQLIFSVELIDKLAQLINKKKASRSTVSNQLVTIINTASADANNAVAVTLTALNSCYVAMASSSKAEKITLLECKQSIGLYGLVSGDVTGERNLLAALNKVEQAQQSAVDADTKLTQDSTNQTSPAPVPSPSSSAELTQAQEDLKKAQWEFDQMKKARDESVAKGEHRYEDFSEGLDQEEADLTAAQARVNALTAQGTTSAAPDTSPTPAISNDLKSALTAFQQIVAQTLGFNSNGIIVDELKQTSLSVLINNANTKAIDNYNEALKASDMVLRQLSQAQTNLTSAIVDLNSLKAGLAAATAAALAA